MLGIPVVSGKNEDEIFVFIKKYPGGGMGFRIPGLDASHPQHPELPALTSHSGSLPGASTALLRRQDFKGILLASLGARPSSMVRPGPQED